MLWYLVLVPVAEDTVEGEGEWEVEIVWVGQVCGVQWVYSGLPFRWLFPCSLYTPWPALLYLCHHMSDLPVFTLPQV